MAQILQSVSKHLKPSSTKGLVQTSVVFIGADKILTFIDNLAGGPTQKIGVAVPLIGRISVLDGIEYLIVAGGAKFKMDAVIGWVVTKFFNAGARSIPFLGSQISSGSGSTQVSPAVVTTGPGAQIG